MRTIILTIPFLLLTALLLFQGCKKDITSIGLDLKDDLLNAVFTDTTVILTAHSVKEDTLNTTGLIFNYLGFLNDPVFGATTAGIYTQFIPQGNIFSFGGVQDCDSIVLTLRYTGGFYGDTLYNFAIKVYELSESISADRIYYQNNTVADKGIDQIDLEHFDLANFKVLPNTKVKLKSDTLLEPHIRIRLKDELGNRFLQNVKEMSSEDAFKRFFKGLYISAESGGSEGCLVNFSLVNSLSGIQLYYTENGKAKQFSFIVNNTATVRFSSYKHVYKDGGSEFPEQTIENGKEVLYIQAMGGVKTKIEFPNIKIFKEINKGKVVINKAELVITNMSDNLDKYPNPNRLGIQGVNSSGKLVIIPDAITGGGNYYGGDYNESKLEYRFRITRYIQDIIWKDNYQPFIYLVTEGAAAYPNRLILKGTAINETSRLRLEVYYTEY